MKKILVIILLFVSFLAININTNATSNGITNTVLNSSGEVIDDVSYKSYQADLSFDGINTKQNINYVKTSNSKVRSIVWSKRTNGFENATVIDIAKDFELNNKGLKVIAGINADYFSGNTSINAEGSMGVVIQGSNHQKYQSLAFNENGLSHELFKTMSLESNYSLKLIDTSTLQVLKEMIVPSFNSYPNDLYQTTIYYNQSNPIISNVSYYATTITLNNTRSSQTKMFSGNVVKKYDQELLQLNNLYIASIDEEVIDILKTNPSFVLSRNFANPIREYDNVVGVGSNPLINGVIKDFDEIGDQNLAFTKERHPRSSIGFTKDGDVIISIVDGRQTISQGINLREEAFIMKELGCIDCYNLDGGGSSSLIIRDNDSFKCINSPTENRKVTNAILFVINEYSNGFDYSITKNDNTINLSIDVYDSFDEIQVYMNNKKIDCSNIDSDTINLNIAYDKEIINTLSVVGKKNGTLRCLLNKRIVSDSFTGVYKAKEKTKFIINLDLNGGTISSDKLRIDFEKDEEIELPTPVKEGYKFIGWYEGFNLIKRIANKDYNLTAKWEQLKTYRIIYDLDGGSCDGLLDILIEDEKFVLPTPTKEGYRFLGWYEGDNLVVMCSGRDYNLEALFIKTKKDYVINYDLDGGTIEDGNLSTIFTEGDNVILPIPTKDGFKFLGWYEDDELIDHITFKNYNLVAKYEKISGCNNKISSLFTIYQLVAIIGVCRFIVRKKK